MILKKTLLICVSLSLLVTTSSCLKKQDLDDASLGPAVDANEIQKVMAEGVGGFDYNEIRVNESSTMKSVTTIEETQNIPVYEQKIRVGSVSEDGKINLLFDRADYTNDANSFKDKPFVLNSDVSDATGPAPYFTFSSYIYVAMDLCRNSKVTCHNLQINVSKMKLSPDLADPRICDIANCQITVQKTEFDLIESGVTGPDGKPQRSHLTFMTAPRLPFFSKVMQFCDRRLESYKGRSVLVEDCMSLTSFTVGD